MARQKRVIMDLPPVEYRHSWAMVSRSLLEVNGKEEEVTEQVCETCKLTKLQGFDPITGTFLNHTEYNGVKVFKNTEPLCKLHCQVCRSVNITPRTDGEDRTLLYRCMDCGHVVQPSKNKVKVARARVKFNKSRGFDLTKKKGK